MISVCEVCNGTGVIMVHITDGIGIGAKWVPCEACESRRSARIAQ